MEGSPQTEIHPLTPVLQAANDVLRRQVRAAVSQEQRIKAMQELISQMEHSAETGGVELLTVRRALAQRDAQVSTHALNWADTAVVCVAVLQSSSADEVIEGNDAGHISICCLCPTMQPCPAAT